MVTTEQYSNSCSNRALWYTIFIILRMIIMAYLPTCGQQKRLIRSPLLTTCYCDTFLIDITSNFISLTKAVFVEFHVQNSFKKWGKKLHLKWNFWSQPTVDPNIFDHIFWGAKLLFLQHLSRKSGPHAESASTRNRSFGRETNPSKL